MAKKTILIIVSLFVTSLATKAVIPNEKTNHQLSKITVVKAIQDRDLISKSLKYNWSKNELYHLLKTIAFERSESMEIRWQAMAGMSSIGSDSLLADLAFATKHKEWFIRNAGLLGLLKLDPVKAKKIAMELAKDPALVVRSSAIQVLTTNRQNLERDFLWSEFQAKYNFRGTQSLWIREQIIEALSVDPLDKEKEKFVKILKSEPNLDIQFHSVNALEKMTGIRLSDQGLSKEKTVARWQDKIKGSTF